MLKYWETSGIIVNKSHALEYALISYNNAYLKANYPTEFMSVLLSLRVDKPDKFKRYINEAKAMGIKIRPPNINKSGLGFTPIGLTEISFGFNAIKGIGSTATEKILEARDEKPFKDLYDFLNRVDLSKVNSGVINMLAMCGAFDCLQYNRQKLIDILPDVLNYYAELNKYNTYLASNIIREEEIASWQIEFDKWEELRKLKLVEKVEGGWNPARPKKPTALKPRDPPVKPDLEPIKEEKRRISLTMVKWEGQYCSYFISAHPLDFFKFDSASFTSIESIDPIVSKGTILAAILSKEEIKIKNGPQRGKKMCKFTVEDKTGIAELTVFAKTYEDPQTSALDCGDIIASGFKLDEKVTTDSMTRLISLGQIKRIS